MKKLLSLVLSLAIVLCLAACGGGKPQSDVYTVGILQQLEHRALDSATEGFKAALIEKLGDKVVFEYENAQNDQGNCVTIANKFVNDGVDLIMANATTALQSAAAATNSIPIVGTSITDYSSAGVLVGTADAPGGNVTGVSDLAPLDKLASLLLRFCPDAKTIGILYCSSEANSVYQCEAMKKFLTDAGRAVKVYTVADSNEIQSVLTLAAEQVDALYIPTDNTLADNMELVKNITVPAKLPVFTGEENMCAAGGLATVSISYYDVGYKAGLIAAKILTGDAQPATTPIEYCTDATEKYNADVAAAIGITVPEGVEAIG